MCIREAQTAHYATPLLRKAARDRSTTGNFDAYGPGRHDVDGMRVTLAPGWPAKLAVVVDHAWKYAHDFDNEQGREDEGEAGAKERLAPGTRTRHGRGGGEGRDAGGAGLKGVITSTLPLYASAGDGRGTAASTPVVTSWQGELRTRHRGLVTEPARAAQRGLRNVTWWSASRQVKSTLRFSGLWQGVGAGLPRTSLLVQAVSLSRRTCGETEK